MRKLVTVETVEQIKEIEGADAIELAIVRGWQCVVRKGDFKVGDTCIYHEIDSLCPDVEPYTSILSRQGLKRSQLEDGTIVTGYRIKTIKLRGQISQGLVLKPESIIPLIDEYEEKQAKEGSVTLAAIQYFALTFLRNAHTTKDDISHVVGVTKFELPLDPSLRGRVRGNFPSFIKKTDQERVQNIKREVYQSYLDNVIYQVTVKLDGSSITVYRKDGVEGVCSRNLDLDLSDTNNMFVAMGNKIHCVARDEIDGDYCFQAELLAPSIQGNFEGVTKPELMIYSQFSIADFEYVAPHDAENNVDKLLLDHVPVLGYYTLKELFGDVESADELLEKILAYADGASGMNGKYREGVVFKACNSQLSWKAISNQYLCKEK